MTKTIFSFSVSGAQTHATDETKDNRKNVVFAALTTRIGDTFLLAMAQDPKYTDHDHCTACVVVVCTQTFC
jgi:hypothetical protein